uniref:cysteine-S-conjugate beta-lyase n=1 Tax=Mesoaciditoga lauensis TaxID=1495039 RepID=A0A7V3VT14_9BACT
MEYNFDEYVDRHGTNSRKWERMEELFGKNDLLPMWIADMDFRAPHQIVEALKKRAEHGIFGYTFRPDAFYDSARQWISKRNNWNVEKEWMVDSSGVVSAIIVAVLSYTKPGDGIIVQPPVYYPFFNVIKNNDRKILYNDLIFENGRYTMNFEDLENKVKDAKMLILCNPHNPVGRVWTEEELARLGKICLDNDVIIASDEIHSDFIYEGYKHVHIASLDGLSKRTVTFIAPNKTFNLAGIPASISIIPDEGLRKSYGETMVALGIETSNIFSITATEAAYRYGEEWFEALLKYLRGNIEFLKAFLNDRLPDVQVVVPEGTYLVWLNFRKLGLTDDELSNLIIKKAKVALDDGNMFGHGGSGFQRMNIATPRSLLKDGLESICKAVQGEMNERG